MTKIRILALALAAITVTLLMQGTVAFYTAKGTATNVVTAGDITLEIVEQHGDEAFPSEGVYIMPGKIVSKKVWVKNVCGHPFYLRIKLTNGIDDTALSADCFEIDFNTEDWTLRPDGYYYYNNVVAAGAETTRLFDEVKIAGRMDNAYLGKTLTIQVDAEAVQSENNPADAPWLVAGWPASDDGGLAE